MTDEEIINQIARNSALRGYYMDSYDRAMIKILLGNKR